ncbi:MAG: hypothetical protein CBC24_02850 [Candidatus Pelagibacter sp. TMED64]|nr:hypothetical protein [Candidatus Pelagibacter sp.]OUU66676.1 MAG: hypothetical protein CBC24_02850 [Candidatus Pelagibacter sp. TMED64]|tara:strand:- start:12 stop:296 length:285 start_codon:yes stop_codon:yes gene_type:complete
MAHQLGVTLDVIYNMSFKEYIGWVSYFNKRPYGWRDDHRSAIIAQTTYQGTKPLKIKDLFPSLKLLENSSDNQNIKLKLGFEELKNMVNKKSKT